MDAEKYSRSITLNCPTCGGTDFKYDTEDSGGPVECAGCNRILTREELMSENQRNIDAHVEQMGDEMLKDVQKEFSDMLRKAVGNSKYIKIK